MLVLLHVVKAGPDYVIQKSPLFAVLLAMSMLERLSAFAADVAIERDYVPQLAGAFWHYYIRAMIIAWSDNPAEFVLILQDAWLIELPCLKAST